MVNDTSDAEDEEITSSAEFLWCFFCSGQLGKSCSHHFVLNLPSQTSQISLSQPSSVRTNPDKVLVVLVAVSAFQICGLRHPMKLVPFATRDRMEVKAFPSRPSVPLLITNSIVHQ
ncbi:putative FdxN element excision controlling factor XisI [Trichinella spiralis]|uniref:putative FdxN element excision controlling factor XisI n=1 Tax=Trichinella spiralis TaxID=6334 RepID=UPI0001EFCC07|nr:putative FdxN element excision controlling factor XisI [Trichinella spiralis]